MPGLTERSGQKSAPALSARFFTVSPAIAFVALHVNIAAARLSQKLPATHPLHAVAPTAFWYHPAGQSLHSSAPLASWNVPIAQRWHSDRASDPWYQPAGQSVHVRASVPKVPATHGVCAVLPSGQSYPASQLVIVAAVVQ